MCNNTQGEKERGINIIWLRKEGQKQNTENKRMAQNNDKKGKCVMNRRKRSIWKTEEIVKGIEWYK